MYWIPVLLLGAFLFTYEFFKTHKWLRAVLFTALAAVIMGLTIWIDYISQATDTEIWSGYIEDWRHEEEWDEWIPPETTCTTDSNGKQTCTTEPGYWEHHPAENYLKTTDKGWFSIYYTPEGKKMNDRFPNKKSELEEMFPYGTATASKHSYINKVQASYSIYKHEEIDLKEYPDLPDYPDKVRDYIYVDRILGQVPKKKEALVSLNLENTRLNEMIPDPENPGKKKSYKQVNMIFVNVGEGKTIDYGYALQDKWEGGNKNDFVVAFSMDKKGNVEWAYPFSWSEVELLKLEVKDYMESLKGVKDFTPVIKEVSKEVEEQFVRKEFADFNYLQLEVSKVAHIIIWVLSILNGILYTIMAKHVESNSRRYGFNRTRRPF